MDIDNLKVGLVRSILKKSSIYRLNNMLNIDFAHDLEGPSIAYTRNMCIRGRSVRHMRLSVSSPVGAQINISLPKPRECSYSSFIQLIHCLNPALVWIH
jgi:hypothetical protein